MTNREKVNQMTNKELAVFINSCDCACCVYTSKEGCSYVDCYNGVEKWLDSEVQENEVNGFNKGSQ